jgi:RNA polymerase sigma-70 factor (ECF subfamily)
LIRFGRTPCRQQTDTTAYLLSSGKVVVNPIGVARIFMGSQVAKPRGGSLKWEPGATAFDDVVTAYQRELFATALRILGERTLAEDALQDTFLKAYRALDGLDPGSNIRAWLYRILMNTAYDQLDRQKTRAKAMDSLREKEQSDPKAQKAPPEEYKEHSEADIRRQVEDAIRELPAKFRQPLMLRHIQGLSYSEVGESLDIPEATARTLVFRGKRMLLPKLKHLLEES